MIAKLSGIAKSILLGIQKSRASPFYQEGDTLRMKYDSIKISSDPECFTSLRVSFRYCGDEVFYLTADRIDLTKGDSLMISHIQGSQEVTLSDS